MFLCLIELTQHLRCPNQSVWYLGATLKPPTTMECTKLNQRDTFQASIIKNYMIGVRWFEHVGSGNYMRSAVYSHINTRPVHSFQWLLELLASIMYTYVVCFRTFEFDVLQTCCCEEAL